MDAPEFIQEQIAREIVDDFDQGYDVNDYKDMVIELYEYDPKIGSDKETLEGHLNEKIRNEGEPLVSDLQFYIDHPEELITTPILIFQGQCAEGRHRLMTSLKTMKPIRMYVV